MVEEWKSSIEVSIAVFKKKKRKKKPNPPNESVTWYLLKLLRVDLEKKRYIHPSVNHHVLLWFLFLEHACQRNTCLMFELSNNASLLRQFSVLSAFVFQALLLMEAVLTTHTLELPQNE